MKRRPKRGTKKAHVDPTSMIDVVFLLVIFFVVTMTLNQESTAKDIALPPAKNSIDPPEEQYVRIQVDKRGRFRIGANRHSDEELRIILQGTANRYGSAANVPVVIHGDQDTPHRAIRRAMDICAKKGITRIRFAGMKSKG